MKLYFAPMEGITTATFRRTHAELFDGADAYFAPFLTPSDNEKITKKGIAGLLPDQNPQGVPKAQVLCTNALAFHKFTEKIKCYGFSELNLNLGCPSNTVTRKGRGAGFLKDKAALSAFLDQIFAENDIRISIKTRTGYESGAEMDELIAMYNRHPVSLLIVHARAGLDYYKGTPDLAAFRLAYEKSKHPLCYNGDICSADDYNRIITGFPDLDSVMIGRGALKNPALFREIRGGKALSTDELIAFARKLCENYLPVMGCEKYTLQKLKEIWVYVMLNFPDEPKLSKAIKKANTLADFFSAVECLPEL